MKIYIAGPMTGLPDYNRPAFNKMAKALKGLDYVVLNPAVLPDGLRYCEYMAITLKMVEICDIVVLLPGWEKSKGAQLEKHHAEVWGKLIEDWSEVVEAWGDV